jgi:putative nucleotidyltransferase with HDIG domain
MDKIPKEILEWFEYKANEYAAICDQNSRWMIEHKVEHSKRVVKWGEKIMKDVNWPKEKFEDGLIVCLLHDVGRFAQAIGGKWDEKFVNHAEVGVKIAKESNLFESEILEAIKEHNNPFYKGENILAKLVRDADQMTILEELEIQIKIHGKFKKKDKRISEGLIKKYKNKEIIDSKEVGSLGEWLIQVASWRYWFNFNITNELFDEYKYLNQIKEKLVKFYPIMKLEEIWGN